MGPLERDLACPPRGALSSGLSLPQRFVSGAMGAVLDRLDHSPVGSQQLKMREGERRTMYSVYFTMERVRWTPSKGGSNDPAGSDVHKGNLRLQEGRGGRFTSVHPANCHLGYLRRVNRVEAEAPHSNVICRVEPGQAACSLSMRLLHAKTDLNARDVHCKEAQATLSRATTGTSHPPFYSSSSLILRVVSLVSALSQHAFKSAIARRLTSSE
jgi:hypothetical protein